MRKLLIFDFDGVIADTVELHLKLSQQFVPGTTLEDHIEHGMGNALLEPAIKYKKSDYEPYFSLYNKLVLDVNLFPIEHLKSIANDHIFVICSSSPKQGIMDFLKKHKIDMLFSNIYDVYFNPSKVEKLRSIISDYNMEPGNCLFITDTVGDINEAKKVGIDSVGITWGMHSRQILLTSGPLGIIDKIDELDKYL